MDDPDPPLRLRELEALVFPLGRRVKQNRDDRADGDVAVRAAPSHFDRFIDGE